VIDMTSGERFESASRSADASAAKVATDANAVDTAAVDTAAVDTAARALSRGPMGAYLIAGIAVGLLFIGWLAFYFLLFMQRGSIG
jgi:asparagine N-glycosylation enzyme membrane subunit Stt3